MEFTFLQNTSKMLVESVKLNKENPPYFEGSLLNNMIEQIIGLRFTLGKIIIESDPSSVLIVGENISFEDYAAQFEMSWKDMGEIASTKTTIIEISSARGLRQNSDFSKLKSKYRYFNLRAIQDGNEYELNGKIYKLYVLYPEFPEIFVYNHNSKNITDEVRAKLFESIHEVISDDPSLLDYRVPKDKINEYYDIFFKKILLPVILSPEANAGNKSFLIILYAMYQFCGLDVSSQRMLLPDIYMNLAINIIGKHCNFDEIEFIKQNLPES